MGTISEKLVYLNGTKQAIKQAINEDFEVIDNNTTFREYADEISSNNAKYKDLIPKETKNATNTLDISNSSGLDKALVTQYGNTYQRNATGDKNIFNDSTITSVSNGTNNNGIITSITKNNESINLIPFFTNISVSEGDTIYISADIKLNTDSTGVINNVNDGVNANFTKIVFPTLSTNYQRYQTSFTYSSSTNIDKLLFQFFAVTGSIEAKNIMISKNSNIDYESYVVPSPSSPQEIVNISGKSILKDVGKNLFDGILEIGNFNTNTGEKIANNDYIINTNPIPVEELTNYKISSNGTGIRMYVFEYKEDMTYNLSSRKTVNADSYLTTNSGTKYINFRTIDANTDLQEKIQVEKGSTASTYEPYKEQSFDLDLKSKNLFDNITTKQLITSNGTITNNNSWNLGDYIKVKPSTQYTFSRFDGTAQSLIIGEYNKNKEYIQRNVQGGTNAITPYTITTTANTEYIRLNYDNTKGNTKLQFEQNSTGTDYEPFYDINLCKIGTYKDRIYPLNGKWYLEKKMGNVVLDGSENWQYYTGNVLFLETITDYLQTTGITCICNYYLTQQNPNSTLGMIDKHIAFRSSGSKSFYIKDTTYSDSGIFKNWLSTHNTEVYYVLATPTTTEITENNYPTLYEQLNNIKLFEGVNHITMTNESGLDVEFDIEYYKDWKLD